MRYAFKKARRVRLYDIATDKHLATVRDLQSAQFTGDQETQYAEGLDGARLAAFDLNKVAGFEAVNGAVDTDYLALQVGDEEVVISNGHDIKIREVHKTTDGSAITLDHKASGTAGAEIGYIYAVREDGNPGKAYAQAGVLSSTEFTYTEESKAIALPTGAFNPGDDVIVEYYPTFATYRQITNSANRFSKTCKVIVDAWFTDICDETDVPMMVVMDKGKISGTIDLSYGDQAAVQNISIEGMASACSDDQTLWKMYTYDMEEITD